MNFIKYTTVISIIILFTSCSITKKVAKSVVGKWQITSIKSNNLEGVSNAFVKTANDMLKGSYIDFKEDKTYEISVLGKIRKGTWSISEDGKKILTSEKDRYFEIVSLVENVLTLKSVKGGEVFNMVLKK